jgi:hypothetical protein
MGTKISALPSATALAGTEVLAGVQGGANVKVTATQIRTFVVASLATVASSGSASDLSAGTLGAARLPAFSGDISTSAGSSVTAIGTNKVTRAMLAQTAGAAIMGATSAGNVADLTAAQAKALLAITAADLTLPVSTQTGTTYTAVLGDANTYIRFNNSTSITFTVPTNASVAYPIGTEIAMEQVGVGSLIVAGAGGVTINSRGGDLTLAGQFSVAMLKKVATDTWTLTGDM